MPARSARLPSLSRALRFAVLAACLPGVAVAGDVEAAVGAADQPVVASVPVAAPVTATETVPEPDSTPGPLTMPVAAATPGNAADVPGDVPAPEAGAVAGAAADTVTQEGGRPRLVVPASCQGAGADARWVDRAQGYWSERACVPAVWFDRFFGGGRADDVATALVRLIPSVQYSERAFTETGIRVKAKVSLPQMEDRLSVVINDDDDAERGLLPGEVERPEQANAADRGSSLAFRYLRTLRGSSRVDADIGLRSELKLFTQLRYRTLWPQRPGLQTRFTQSLFFRDGEGFGETSLVEVERMLAEDMLLRWSTQATVSELANGLELREGIQLLRQLDADRAISWNIATTMRSDPVWQAQAYGTSVRYRKRAFRTWFFYEVEPFVDWIRADGFETNPGIAFRVEVWLGDTHPVGRPASDSVAPGPAAGGADVPGPDVPAAAGGDVGGGEAEAGSAGADVAAPGGQVAGAPAGEGGQDPARPAGEAVTSPTSAAPTAGP